MRDEAWLEPRRARALLDAYGIPLVAERLAPTPDEAVAAAARARLPVVVKTAAAGAHKTETGGVALDLRDGPRVREAATRIGGPVIVQPMIRGGVELLAGVAQDPVFGPLVAFGPGGVFAELIGDAQFRLAPLTDVDAGRARARRARRGGSWPDSEARPPADAAALVDILLRLSRLADEIPELAELDLNPVLGLPDRCVAVDARIRLAPAESRSGAKTW